MPNTDYNLLYQVLYRLKIMVILVSHLIRTCISQDICVGYLKCRAYHDFECLSAIQEFIILKEIITVRNSSCGKVMYTPWTDTHTPWPETPPWADISPPPLGQKHTPPGTHTPLGRHPPVRHPHPG